MTRALAVAIVVAVAGPLIVLLAFGHAGGGDRPRPHPGLLDAQGECVSGDSRLLPRYDPLTGRPIPFPACPNLYPADLEASTRAGWIGLFVGLAGAVFFLVLASGWDVPRGTAYWSMVGVACVQLLVAGMIALSSLQTDFIGLGSEPDPWDMFDRAAQILAISSVLVIPLGATLREARIRRRSATQG